MHRLFGKIGVDRHSGWLGSIIHKLLGVVGVLVGGRGGLGRIPWAVKGPGGKVSDVGNC